MSFMTPVGSQASVSEGQWVLVYDLPAGKSHAYIDVVFFKKANPGHSLVAVAVTNKTNTDDITSVNTPFDDIELLDESNFSSLEKVLVGSKGSKIYVKVQGDPVNVNLVGMEMVTSKVAEAGPLAELAVTGTTATKLYECTVPDAAYIPFSLTVYNTSASQNAVVEIWMTNTGSVSDSNQFFNFTIAPQDTANIENMQILPSTQIWVKSSIANTEYNINGMVKRA